VVKIRRARKSELARIVSLDARCFREDDRVEMADDDLWWVGVDGDKIVCYAGAQLWEAGRESALYLYRAGVAKSHRGQGLQLRMIRARVSEAKRRGLDEVWTYTSHVNVPSMNNLIRAGFTTWLPLRWDGEVSPWRPHDSYGWVFWRRKISDDRNI
jgi:ribosomal protein S18 acetylase RimI-like enzyme